jgi:hypothetical protein
VVSACDNASCKPHPSFIHFPLLVLMLIDASEAEERSNDIRGCFGPWAGEPEM